MHYHKVPVINSNSSNSISNIDNVTSQVLVPKINVSYNIEETETDLENDIPLTPTDITNRIQSSLLIFIANYMQTLIYRAITFS